MNRFDEIRKLQAELDEKLKSFGQQGFAEHYAPFFEACPEVDGLVWSQYTPYFNDGDPCEFNVYDIYIVSEHFANLAENDDDIYVEEYMHEHAISTYGNKNSRLDEIDSLLSSYHNQVPEALYLPVFGDHAQVTIFRDGTCEIEEYAHD